VDMSILYRGVLLHPFGGLVPQKDAVMGFAD